MVKVFKQWFRLLRLILVQSQLMDRRCNVGDSKALLLDCFDRLKLILSEADIGPP